MQRSPGLVEVDAIASLLALHAPTALLVEADGVLGEREVDAKLLLECIASYLVLSITSKLGQPVIKFGILLISINSSSRHEVIVDRIVFDVEHDERYDTLDQTVIKFGIFWPSIRKIPI